MRDICVWFIVVAETFFGLCYVYKILKGKADPTISTWIIFLVGCTLSFATYVLHTEWDLKSGIINTTDLVYVVVIFIAILLCGKPDKREAEEDEEGKKEAQLMKSFEKWYLAGAGGIVAYGVITGNAWNSNVLTQILMSFAYFPMFHKMLKQKKKKDSYFAWLPAASISLLGLYPAISGGNTLAVIYASRALFFSSVTCLIMAYYQFVNPDTEGAPHRFFW